MPRDDGRYDPAQTARVFERVQDQSLRHRLTTEIAKSIRLAHAASSVAWSISTREERVGKPYVRLNAGRLEVLYFDGARIGFSVDRRAFSDAEWDGLREDARFSIGWGREQAFKVLPFALSVQLPVEAFDDLFPKIVTGHHQLVEAAARSMHGPGPFARGHCPGVLVYLRSALQEQLPDPDHARKAEPADLNGSRGGKQALFDATHLDEPFVDELVALLQEKRQIVLEGPPGSGKTWVADKLARYLTGNPLSGPTDDRVRIVQFHQSYGYEDFVQGIRPESTSDGQLHYRVVPGVFGQLCIDARAHPDDDYVLIIDEINRGNLSRIFGELLMLLEYRDMEIQLAQGASDAAPDGRFSIPPNVLIIGTMNSTDRSLALIDYALRRRFYFVRMLPVHDGRAPVLERWLERAGLPSERSELLLRLFISLNEGIARRMLSDDYQVGHSYFMVPGIHEQERLELVWRRAVLPLLEEYFHGARDRAALLRDFAPDELLRVAGVGEGPEREP